MFDVLTLNEAKLMRGCLIKVLRVFALMNPVNWLLAQKELICKLCSVAPATIH